MACSESKYFCHLSKSSSALQWPITYETISHIRHKIFHYRKYGFHCNLLSNHYTITSYHFISIFT